MKPSRIHVPDLLGHCGGIVGGYLYSNVVRSRLGGHTADLWQIDIALEMNCRVSMMIQ